MTAVLGGFARTLLVPLVVLVALPVEWTLTAADGGWSAAVAAVGAGSLVSAAWLRLRGWPWPLVHLVSWDAPAALLAPLAALGELSADGLVLWGPMATALAVGLATTNRAGTVE